MKKLHVVGKSILILVASFWLFSCSSLDVKAKYDPLTDFYGYKNFSWRSNSSNTEFLPVEDQEVLTKIKQEINRALRQRGFVLSDSAKSDFYLMFELRVKPILSTATVDQLSYQPLWGMYGTLALSAQQYHKGTLVLDAMNAESHQVIWRGTVTGVTGERTAEVDEKIRDAVEMLIGYFPAWFDE